MAQKASVRGAAKVYVPALAVELGDEEAKVAEFLTVLESCGLIEVQNQLAESGVLQCTFPPHPWASGTCTSERRVGEGARKYSGQPKSKHSWENCVQFAKAKQQAGENIRNVHARTQEKSGEQALLAESLTTHGLALARLGQFDRARTALQRAIEMAALVGDNERAGLAAITILEELSDQLSNSEITAIYERAASLLSQSQHLDTLLRLLACSRRALAMEGYVK